MIKLNVKRLRDGIKMPSYATEGAGCMDIWAPVDVLVPSGAMCKVGTGIAVEIPFGYTMFVYGRSGHGIKHQVVLSNGTGVIDSDYRGEIVVSLRNHGNSDLIIRKDSGLAQFAIVRTPLVAIQEVDEVSQTARGEGGFGSTDKV